MSAPEPTAKQGEAKRAQANLKDYHEESHKVSILDGALLRLIGQFLLPHQRYLYLALTTVVGTSALSLLRPLIMLYAIDQSIATKDPTAIMYGGFLYTGVAILEQILGFIQVYTTQILGARAMSDLRATIFKFLLELPQRFFDTQPVGRLVTRVTNDVDAILELFNSGALNAIGDLIRLVGVVILMLSLDVKLASFSFAVLPLIILLMIWVRRRARDSFRTIRAETARMNSNMNEQVNGVALVQAYGRGDAMAAQFDVINSSYRDANIRSVKYDAIQDAAIDAVSGVCLASMVTALGFQEASFGTVVALTAYLRQFFEPISMLAQRFTLLQSALSGAERVFGLLQVKDRDAPQLDPQVLSQGDAQYAFEFNDVSFGYKQNQLVLNDVSLRAYPGETVALVGPTGSGKTTITSLLLRLYDIEKGAIYLDGCNISGLDRTKLRRKFSVVPQDVYLFPGSIADNIAAGEIPDLTRVKDTLLKMGCYDLFARRAEGLLSLVQNGGTNFSAGQRQLIALARALYRDAELLILDEATANIDSDTEAQMQKALTSVMAGRTTIVVAHRLATIMAAQRICVLQKGRIVERGKHEELLQKDGLYAALYRLQFAPDKSV